ncbi:MAG: class I SAM-dependent methyltransferase [Gammaproteobacteria bacterium]|nr:class I SAM-dependent methyltransferase [Gammaproteobacteria bacterium]
MNRTSNPRPPAASAVEADQPAAGFDRAYFQRFYANPATRVALPADYANLARFLAAYLRLLKLPVASILDVGAGMGGLRRPLLRAFPGSEYRGIDVSDYVCARYGWQQRSIVDFAPGCFDLVVCHDVAQYLSAREASDALCNLAELCRGALYFSALTREDWRNNCDQQRTDRAVHLRSARWYAERLKPAFRNAGGGVFIARRANAVCYALHAGA